MLHLPNYVIGWIKRGHGKAYSEDLSPLRLGQAVEAFDEKGRRYYKITDAGRRKARSMTASRVRRASKHEDSFL